MPQRGLLNVSVPVYNLTNFLLFPKQPWDSTLTPQAYNNQGVKVFYLQVQTAMQTSLKSEDVQTTEIAKPKNKIK